MQKAKPITKPCFLGRFGQTILCCLIFFCGNQSAVFCQGKSPYWHGIERSIRYKPDGTDFVIENGNRRFTRALYGTNTAFRVEAGDLPEFALYMPGMGGNMKFGLINGDSSKWLINAAHIVARYNPGSMHYEITDAILGEGKLFVDVLALGDAEGVIIKVKPENISNKVRLLCCYGGASGKKFSRDGDMGPDPESSFYLKPEYCADNRYTISNNQFNLSYGSGLMTEWDPYVNKNFASDTVKPVKAGKEQSMKGVFPNGAILRLADAGSQQTPLQLNAAKSANAPVLTSTWQLISQQTYFVVIQNSAGSADLKYKDAQEIYDKAETFRRSIAGRIIIKTPDAYINTLGGVLSTAADAIWETPTYLHGSIGWRMRLNGWRGPYVGDVLGWHDRAKTHFKAYALSQVDSPLTGPVIMDTALHLARSLEKMGTSVYSSGYISRNPNGDFRPHHYDMNLVYIDALLRHFKWTGDLVLAKELWPVIKRHLAWEKRNFDADNDGLYDAYAAIWASDALEYSGGAVTHTSAYNYKANKEAAVIAKLIGEDSTPYEKEAAKILAAINKTLWMPATGRYSEFKDLLGNQLLHPQAAVWTIYHSIDSDVSGPLQAYQCIQYVDEKIPHIPVRAKGLEDGYATISTTNWMPYDWSLNNVATAEVMHTALAHWQAGKNEEAFLLWKSELLSTMYLGGSPGNIGQISFYDAARGEAYRDFADPVAMTARSTIEGLFGINPDLLSNTLLIKPGFPNAWNSASLNTPDIVFDFNRKGKIDHYNIKPKFNKPMQLLLQLRANGSNIKSITVNGKKAEWKNTPEAVGDAMIEIKAGTQKLYDIVIEWLGNKITLLGKKSEYAAGSRLAIQFPGAKLQKLYDPQQVLLPISTGPDSVLAEINGEEGPHSFFVEVLHGAFSYWQPININIKKALELLADSAQPTNGLRFKVVNHTDAAVKGFVSVNPGATSNKLPFSVAAHSSSPTITTGTVDLIPGTNLLECNANGYISHQTITSWRIQMPVDKTASIALNEYYNDKLENIFKNQYLSPRPVTATLQLPVQGIGDWTHPLKTVTIDDKGLRKLAGDKNSFAIPQGIMFSTPADTLQKNICFVSQWDNYPKKLTIPLSGQAAHAYFLMAGSANPMQSRITNGLLIIKYADGSNDTLVLKNPESWWPIEQDYMDDGYAFQINAPRPVRIHLKTGKIVSALDGSIDAYNGKMVDGGAATVLDMVLDKSKTLQSLQLEAVANDVVIGLMSVTLMRE